MYIIKYTVMSTNHTYIHDECYKTIVDCINKIRSELSEDDLKRSEQYRNYGILKDFEFISGDTLITIKYLKIKED